MPQPPLQSGNGRCSSASSSPSNPCSRRTNKGGCFLSCLLLLLVSESLVVAGPNLASTRSAPCKIQTPSIPNDTAKTLLIDRRNRVVRTCILRPPKNVMIAYHKQSSKQSRYDAGIILARRRNSFSIPWIALCRYRTIVKKYNVFCCSLVWWSSTQFEFLRVFNGIF